MAQSVDAAAAAAVSQNPVDPFAVAGTSVMFDQVVDIVTGETYLADPAQLASTRNQRMMSAVFNVQNGQYTQILNMQQRIEIELTAMNIQELVDASLLIGLTSPAPSTSITVDTGVANFWFLAPFKHLLNNYQVLYGGSPYVTFNEPWIVTTQYIQVTKDEFDLRRNIQNFEGQYPDTYFAVTNADELPQAPLAATTGIPLTTKDCYSLQPQYHIFGPRQAEPAKYGGGVALSGFTWHKDGANKCVVPQELFQHAFIRTYTEDNNTTEYTSGAVTRYGTINFRDWWTHRRVWWPLAGQRFKLALQMQPNINLFPIVGATPGTSTTFTPTAIITPQNQTSVTKLYPLESAAGNYAVKSATYTGTVPTISRASNLTVSYMQMWMSGIQMDSTLARQANDIYLSNTVKTRHIAPRYLKFPLVGASAGVLQTQVLQGLQGTFAAVDVMFTFENNDNASYYSVGANYNTAKPQSQMTSLTLKDPSGAPLGIPNTPGFMYSSIWGPQAYKDCMFPYLFRSYTFAFSPNITSAHMTGTTYGQTYFNGLWAVDFTPFRTPATTGSGIVPCQDSGTAAGTYQGYMLVLGAQYANLSQLPNGNWVWRPM